MVEKCVLPENSTLRQASLTSLTLGTGFRPSQEGHSDYPAIAPDRGGIMAFQDSTYSPGIGKTGRCLSHWHLDIPSPGDINGEPSDSSPVHPCAFSRILLATGENHADPLAFVHNAAPQDRSDAGRSEQAVDRCFRALPPGRDWFVGAARTPAGRSAGRTRSDGTICPDACPDQAATWRIALDGNPVAEISLWEARQKAAAEGKPMFVWFGSGGSPACHT